MKKVDFLSDISATRAQVGVVSTNVDALLAKANAADDDVDQDIVDAFGGLKSDVDTLVAKSANAPATPPPDSSGGDGSTLPIAV